jgi:hypothetical protein
MGDCSGIEFITKKINVLLRQLDKDNGYFGVICEALDIDHDSDLTEILKAIELLKLKQINISNDLGC